MLQTSKLHAERTSCFRFPDGMFSCHPTEREEKRTSDTGGDTLVCSHKSESNATSNEPVIRGSWQSEENCVLMKSRYRGNLAWLHYAFPSSHGSTVCTMS